MSVGPIGEIWKQPGEIFTIASDFAAVLGVGETLSGPVVTAKDEDTGASAAAILSGGPSISGNTVTQKITGGVSGKRYLVHFEVATSGGSTWDADIRVVVRSL